MPTRDPERRIPALARRDDSSEFVDAGTPVTKPAGVSQAHDARHARRLQVVAFRHAGLTYDRIAQLTGLSRTGVFGICARQAKWGDAGLHDAPGGQRPADGRRMAAAQEASARQLIVESAPDMTHDTGALWTHTAVARLVHDLCGLHLPSRTLAAYLVRWGFVAPPSLLRALAPPGSADTRWLAGSYSAICARARSEDAQIIWGDHRPLPDAACGVRERRGAAAPIEQQANAYGSSAPTLSTAVDNRGRMRWLVSAPGHDVSALIDFMQRLVAGARQKVFLLMRPHAVHRCAAVMTWLIEHEDVIELFDLPRSRPARHTGVAPLPAGF